MGEATPRTPSRKRRPDSDRKPGADSDCKPRADSDCKPGADSERKPGADDDRKRRPDSDCKPGADSDRKLRADSDPKPRAGSDCKPGADSDRKPRADSVRNRERVLQAAHVVFGDGGPTGSLEAIAREADVGIGTLYRHFPTRQALFEAVYRREVDGLVQLAEQLGATLPPLDALRQWMRANVAFVATKKGMSAALAAHAPSELSATSMERLGGAVSALLSRAAQAGVIRDDIGAEDIIRTIVGLCYMHDKSGWQGNVLRILDVFVDGMARR